MWRAGFLLAALLTFAGLTQVISAQDLIDQPAEIPMQAIDPDAARGFSVFDAALIVMAICAITAFFWTKWHHLDAAPPRPEWGSPATTMVLLVGMFVLGQLGAMMVRQALGIALASDGSPPQLSVDEIAKLASGAYAGQAIGLGAFFALRGRAKPHVAGDVRMRRGKSVLIGGMSFLLAWPVVAVVAGLVAWMREVDAGPVAHDTLRQLVSGDMDGWYLLLCVQVLIIAPVMEEVMYRGLLQEIFVQSGLSRWGSIILASAIFAMLHIRNVEPHGVAGLFVLGLALGWAYERTGRLTASIVMHALFNGANLALAVATLRA